MEKLAFYITSTDSYVPSREEALLYPNFIQQKDYIEIITRLYVLLEMSTKLIAM